jgi:TPR repeat protein
MDEVTRQWLARNHLELEASEHWVRRYLAYLTENYSLELSNSESAGLAQAQSQAVRQAVDVFFGKSVPDGETCAIAAQSFTSPQFDLENLKSTPGYEAFGEFAETLHRIRNEPGFLVRWTAQKRYESMRSQAKGRPSLALLVAANAAAERGDERARVLIFEKMAVQGDAKAAQTVALAYYRGGGNLPQDHKQAYRWFYQAWALGDVDGLNGMGVMVNEGKTVVRDQALAFASFAMAKSAADSESTFQRAENNLAALESGVSEATRRRLACVSLGALDAKLEKLMFEPGTALRKRALTEPGRRLGVLTKDLASYYSRDSCVKLGKDF